jgi:hypothetical protein
VSAPLFGNHNSRIAFEASQRKSSLPHSAHIKSFSQAPKENPISITDAFSSRYGVHELQSESAHSEIEEYSQSFAARSASTAQPIFLSPRAESSSFDSNEAHPFETPRSNLRRQAYAIMKASPNISANGDTIHFSAFQNSHAYTLQESACASELISKIHTKFNFFSTIRPNIITMSCLAHATRIKYTNTIENVKL